MNQYKEGDFVVYPTAIPINKSIIMCPVCNKQWTKTGKGYGFVLVSARTHVSACFEKELKRQGLQMKQPYNMEKLAWELEKISNTEKQN